MSDEYGFEAFFDGADYGNSLLLDLEGSDETVADWNLTVGFERLAISAIQTAAVVPAINPGSIRFYFKRLSSQKAAFAWRATKEPIAA